MTNFTLTILFLLVYLQPPASEIESINSSEPMMVESDLVITEIMYHPNSSDSSWEWIEIHNKGTQPINLAGYVLDDNNSTQQSGANIVEGSIAAGGIAILFDADVTTEEFKAVWGELNAIPVDGWPGLNNSGDSIGIWENFEAYEGDNVSQLNVIEQVIYDDANGWVDSNSASSIFLTDVGTDNTIGANWALSVVGVSDAFQSNELHDNTGNDIGSPGFIPTDIDMTPPIIECPEMVETDHDEGFCSVEVLLLVPNATDNVSNEFTFNAIRSDGLELEDPFPVGDTMITWTATDEAGNTSESCDQLVRVVEDELPIAVAQNITIELDESGLATITPEDLNNPETPSFDNCGISEYLASRTEFNCADLNGPVQVEFSVLDVNGNTSALTVGDVTVVDKIKPVLTCGADILISSSNGDPVSLESISEPVVTDNCDTSPILSFNRSDEKELNAPFDVGTTTITWQAVDASGNVEECTQTVVIDFIASMDNDILAFLIPEQLGETAIDEANKTINILMPIGADVTNLTPMFEISEGASSSPASGEPQDFTEVVVYTVFAQDNSEQQWTVLVTVEEDVTPPTFEVKGNTEDFVTELEVGDTYVVGEILNVVDESSSLSQILGYDLVDTSQEGGPFLVTYTVSDGTNSTTIIETVIVRNSDQDLFSITSFTLVNADTNEDLFLLEEGMEINITDLTTMNLNIRANTASEVMSVQLILNGEKSVTRIENVAPFALYGDFPVEHYFGSEFGLGSYSVSAVPYSENGLEGEMGASFSINFSIVEPCANFRITITDSSDPSTCSGSDGFALIASEGGTLPMSYSWGHDETNTTSIGTDLTSGNYTVRVTDANDCVAELTFELQDPVLPEVSLPSFEVVSEDAPMVILAGGSPEGGIYSGENVVDGLFDPSVGEGIYEIIYTYVDENTDCENSAVQTIEVQPVTLQVQSFTLVNADTNQDITDLTEGMQIDVNSLPSLNLNIRANTTDDVQSVHLALSGDLTAMRTENVAPFALYGDFPVENYFGNEFATGSYSVTADPYSEEQLNGEQGTSLTISFELYDPELSRKSSNSMSVYPNPAIVNTTISFKEPIDVQVIYVYDLLGRMVGSYAGSSIEKNEGFVLDVHSIPAGTYYIKSYDIEGNAYQKQVFVRK